jgi:hypothetical protein
MSDRGRAGRGALAVLGVILVVALGLRVGYAASGWSYEPPDSLAYERIAANLYEDH